MKMDANDVLNASLQQLEKLSTDILRGQLILESMVSNLSECDGEDGRLLLAECRGLIVKARDCYSQTSAAVWGLRERLEELAAGE